MIYNDSDDYIDNDDEAMMTLAWTLIYKMMNTIDDDGNNDDNYGVKFDGDDDAMMTLA